MRVPRPCPSAFWRDRAGTLTWAHERRQPIQLPFPGSPLRLNLNHPFHSRNIVAKTAPNPLLRTPNQPAHHRIPMDVPQLLDPLLLSPYIEIVVTLAPEQTVDIRKAHLACNILLKHLQRDRELSTFRFTDQEVYMFRHYDVPAYVESVPAPHSLQRLLEDVPRSRCAEKGIAVVATESDGMQTARFLEPLQAPRHVRNIRLSPVGTL